MSDNKTNAPSYIHTFRTLMHYQKNVLKTLVSEKLELETSTMHKVESSKTLNTCISTMDSDSEEDSVFKFIDKFTKSMDNTNHHGCKIHILCSHITHNDTNKTGILFPFIQYLLEKPAFYHNQATIPSMYIYSMNDLESNTLTIEERVVAHTYNLIHKVYPDFPKLTVENSYVGACYMDKTDDIYVLLDVSHVCQEIYYAGISSRNTAWFALSSEIINTHHMCNIKIDDFTTRFFVNHPELSILNSTVHNRVFPVPDVGYTFSPDIYSARLACMFGPQKTIQYNHHNEVIGSGFIFYPEMDAFNTNKAMTRYAVFHTEVELDKDDDKNEYEYVQEYNLFLPLTYHILSPLKNEIM